METVLKILEIIENIRFFLEKRQEEPTLKLKTKNN